MNSGLGQKGFTVPELLVAVVVFALMAVVGLGLVRAVDYSAAERDARRWTDAAQLAQMLRRYAKDTGSLPAGVLSVTPDGILIGTDDEEMLDLCELVPHYAAALPVDPFADLGDGASCNNSSQELPLVTGYAIRKTADGSYEVMAPLAEGDQAVFVKITY